MFYIKKTEIFYYNSFKFQITVPPLPPHRLAAAGCYTAIQLIEFQYCLTKIDCCNAVPACFVGRLICLRDGTSSTLLEQAICNVRQNGTNNVLFKKLLPCVCVGY